ncbi:MAG: hypothetical protein QG599_2630 [Pseudomonadota bacterium]|nr:hypothetical protein [Pseudomonadota bacterium]
MITTDEDLKSVRLKIADSLLTALTLFGPLAFLASIYRATLIGWQPVMFLQMALLLAIFLMAFLRHRLNLAFKAGGIIGMMLAIAISGVIQFGLLSPAIVFWIATPCIAAMLFGKRSAIRVLIFSIAILSGIGGYVISVGAPPSFDLSIYMTAPQAWGNVVFTTIMVTGALLFSLDVYTRSLIDALAAARTNEAKLLKQTRKLDQFLSVLEDNEAFKVAILNALPSHIAVLDHQGIIIAVNRAWWQFALENGIEPHKPAPNTGIGASYLDVCQNSAGAGAQDGWSAYHGIKAVMDGQLPYFSMEYPCHSSKGSRWFTMMVNPLENVDPGGVVIAHTDVTQLKHTDEQLRIAAVAFESQESMIITDAHTVILKVNQAFTETTGYTAEQVIGQTPRILKSGRHDASFYRAMWDSINRYGRWQGEIWDRHKDGEICPKWLTISAVTDTHGVITHYIGAHLDITARKQAEKRIHQLAFFDALTGLPNRTLLLDRFHQALAASSRSGGYGSLLLIDLDHFKTLNDTYGHDLGDQLLKQVAQRLNACVYEDGTVARWSGDEFVVVPASLSRHDKDAAAQAEGMSEKILAALSQPYLLNDMALYSASSIGVALFSGHTATLNELIKQADLAMRQSKEAGGNRCSFFDPAMESVIRERTELEKDLRQALNDKQFLLHYQAQIMGDGRLTGAEVLVRWLHPRRGMVSPAQFIPLSEETGLILPLGHWVLETACIQLAQWAQSDRAHLTVAVNVSIQQFRQPDFVDQVLAILKSTGANPWRLKLELTESLLADHVEELIEKMLMLKARGVSFSLDDFGTGYSSLMYLKRLPLDQLKIDQSFIRDLLTDPNDAVIAQTIVALAQSLDISVIAEGVETAAQRDMLARFGCHAYQGYFFSRPLPLDQFEQFVQDSLLVSSIQPSCD